MSFVNSNLNQPKDRRSVVTRRDYESLPDTSEFNPNEDMEAHSSSDSHDDLDQFHKTVGQYALEPPHQQRRNRTIIPSNQQEGFIIRSNNNQEEIADHDFFKEVGFKMNEGVMTEEGGAEDYESMMDSLLQQNSLKANVTQNYYQKRQSAAGYNPKILQKQRDEARLSVDINDNLFEEQLTQFSQDRTKQRQVILKTPKTDKKIDFPLDTSHQEPLKDPIHEASSSSEEEEEKKEPQNMSPTLLQKSKDALDSSYEEESEGDSFLMEHLKHIDEPDTIERNVEASPRKKRLIEKQDQDDQDFNSIDKIKALDLNERRHQEVAKESLKKHSVLNGEHLPQENEYEGKIISELKAMKTISNKIHQEEQFSGIKPTCIAMNDLLLLWGTTEGTVQMYSKEKEEEYDQLIHKNKEFIGNAVTCIDVHPLRTDYVVVGYMKGQMVLFDVTNPTKPLKTIKDHHKGSKIVNVKFCDYQGKNQDYMEEHNQHDLETSQHNISTSRVGNQNDEKQIWMFASIDEEGRVLVNTIQKVLFVYNSSKQILVDPTKMPQNFPKYNTIAARFFSKMHPYGDINDAVTLLALSNLNSVHILNVQSKDYVNVLQIKKPKNYFCKRSNQHQEIKAYPPAIAWGVGHSPIFKDKAYSLLAISWGPLIQIVVLLDILDPKQKFYKDGYYVLQEYDKMISLTPKKPSTREDEDYEEEEDLFSNDIENSFNHKGLYIESMHFLTESTLLVLTHDMEMRILHTESFYPDDFYTEQERKLQLISEGKRPEPDDPKHPQLSTSHFDKTLRSSLFGLKYTQTIKFFQGLGIALCENKLFSFSHNAWDQSLLEYKNQAEGNWIRVFARALDFYKGKIKGYAGLAEDEELRQNMMKAGLKLMITDFIQQAIDKQRTFASDKFLFSSPQQPFQGDTSSFLDESSIDIKESLRMLDTNRQDDFERQSHFKIFVRIAIEFCVELQDCYFLFYELFLFFRDEKLEDIFVSELESFIMAGKFSEWEIPNDILQNHLINYYKEQAKPETLEKIIINLNFKQCPKKVALQLIHYSEQHFLSTAILFLYTSVYERKDNSSCIQILFSLCDLYRKADTTNHGSFEKIRLLAQNKLVDSERHQVEKSSTYLGYKLFWVIRLFITGKKFPSGNIREAKWKVYVHDIIQFVMNKEFLTLLLEFDAEALFQILSLLFYEGKPYQFVLEGRDPHTNIANLESINHNQMLKILNDVCTVHADENIKLQYLFFVANISSFMETQQEPTFYYHIAKELLRYHMKFLDFNHHVLERVMSHKKLYRQMSRKLPKTKVPDEFKHLIKSEADLIELVQKSEPMTDQQIQELLKLAQGTQFKRVMIHLLEKKEDYIQCLQLYLDGIKDNEEWTKNYFSKQAFEWIKEKLLLLETKSTLGPSAKSQYEQFRREVMENIKQMVLLNVHESISLIDTKFNGIHKEVIDQLQRHPQEQFIYLETLLKVKQELIQNTIKEYSLHLTNPLDAKKYLELLKLHLKLCCQLNPEGVMPIVEKIVQHSYYPTEDCLRICYENKQIEACALLNKKLGKYFESVQLFIEILKDKLKPLDLKAELQFAEHNNIDTKFCIQNESQLVQSTYLDKIFKKVMKICRDKHGDVDIDKEEEIWYIVLDMLFHFRNMEDLKHSKYCNKFFLQRITLFSELLLQHVKFQSFIGHLVSKNKHIKYKVIRELINNIFFDTRAEDMVLTNAIQTINLTNSLMFKSFENLASSGILFRSLRCFHCHRFLDLANEPYFKNVNGEEDHLTDAFSEQIRIFQCCHTFHMGCIQRICNLRKEDIIESIRIKEDRMKCPKCYSQNFDIETDKGSPIRPRGRQAPQTQKSLTLEPQQVEEQQKKPKVQTRSQSIVQREITKLKKRMENFDQNQESEALTTTDFKMRTTF